MHSIQTEHVLDLLRPFRDDVWGNNVIFEQQNSTAEYLVFPTHHLKALRTFCKPMLLVDRIFVFDEYKEAISKFKSNDKLYGNGACITGQPGIGKSMFLAYAVIERLREKQPVAVQLGLDAADDAYVIFSEEGVTAHLRSDPFSLEDHPGIWVWSDSGVLAQIPTAAFINASGVRIFQTTSPALHRYKEWTKQREVDLYVMDLPSPREIRDFALVLGFDPEQMESLSRKWGRVPRSLRIFCDKPEAEQTHKRRVLTAAAKAAQDIVAALASLSRGAPPDSAGASYIFFTKPERGEDDAIIRSSYTHYIPTKWLCAFLADAVADAEAVQRIQFFKVMSGHPDTRAPAGFMFETIIQHYLNLRKPMTIRWLNPQQATETYNPAEFRVHYAIEDINRDIPFYWRAPRNFPGVDGAIVAKDRVFLLQMTLSSRHTSPQAGVDLVWGSELGRMTKKVPWSLIFVGLDEKVIAVAGSFAGELQYGEQEVRKGGKRKALPVGYTTIHVAEVLGKFHFIQDLTQEEEAIVGNGEGAVAHC